MNRNEEIANEAVIEGMNNAIQALNLTPEFEGEDAVNVLAWGSEQVSQEEILRTLAYEVARAATAIAQR